MLCQALAFVVMAQAEMTFEAFKVAYWRKTENGAEEEQHRESVFMANIERISIHHAKQFNHTMAVNQFADVECQFTDCCSPTK